MKNVAGVLGLLALALWGAWRLRVRRQAKPAEVWAAETDDLGTPVS